MGNSPCSLCEPAALPPSLSPPQKRQLLTLRQIPSLPHRPAQPHRLTTRIEYKQGWVYEGETVEGVREGRGRMVWPSGDSYEGMFSGGRANGEGCFRLVTG